MKMLQKMGWNPGEGLGKNKDGKIIPLLLDVKMDKKGLTAQEEVTPRRTPIPLAKSLSGKHPVSALVEICSKRKWNPPDFEIVFDCGPDHKKNFLMKVHVNNLTYKPAIAASTKKIAKANAAAACLQALGLIPKEPPSKPQSTLNTNPQPQGHAQAQSQALSQPQHPQGNGTMSAPLPQAPPLPPPPPPSAPQDTKNIPQPPLPLPMSAPPPPPPPTGGEPSSHEGTPTSSPFGVHQPVLSADQAEASSMAAQPVSYPTPVGGTYGVSNLYAANYDQSQYYSGAYQKQSF